MTETEKARFELRLTMVRKIGKARWDEQQRTADHIEQLMYEAKSAETCEALVALAFHVFEGAKR